jgi:hypothetical protein
MVVLSQRLKPLVLIVISVLVITVSFVALSSSQRLSSVPQPLSVVDKSSAASGPIFNRKVTAQAVSLNTLSQSSSLLASEIEAISHVASQRKIVIDLKGSNETRMCIRPRFFGRLSGPHLATIRWEKQEPASNQIIGYYHVPMPGQHFVEIISILCNDFDFDTDFEKICIENPSHHRITDNTAFIDVTVVATESQNPLGSWQWSNATKSPSPLLTRYQPQNCKGVNISESRCTEPATLDRFNPYRFVWKDKKASLLQEVQEETNLCLVGLSHSRELKVHMENWLQKLNISNIHLKYLEKKYPTDISAGFVRGKIVNQNCSKIILGLGQWAVGRKPRGYRPPTLFPAYQQQMTRLIQHFQGAKANLYLRSIHYNPLGDTKTVCPPRDWRSPATIDMYNDIIRGLCSEYDVPFIDTQSIMGPVWDSAEDWCHYRGLSGSVEALYILNFVLGAKA